VAVVSLLTAASISRIAAPGSEDYIFAAIALAFLSGAFLVAMGVFRLGFMANFLSHPVITGFITASGLIIAASQLKAIFGIQAEGHNLLQLAESLWAYRQDVNWITTLIGGLTTAFLFWVRKGLLPLLVMLGLAEPVAKIMAKTGPVAAIIATTAVVWLLDLKSLGVNIVGAVPQGLPPLTLPKFSLDLWSSLLTSAILISVIGFVESISVAQTLAAKKRQRIDPDQELIGLGAANIGASLTSGFPVTGGFSRSVVNYDAGAETPAAGAYTAVGLIFASLFLTPLIFFLPKATLAATIIVAVLSLVDFKILGKAWRYSKADFTAVSATMAVTLAVGVETGVITGVLVSILIHLYKSSRPHIATVGQVPKSEHYRNVLRYDVLTQPHILTIRVDESLYFANARYLEDHLFARATHQPQLRHVVLMCSAVNDIDMSALDSLEAVNTRLEDMGVSFHLSEVKGPVMDRLTGTEFFAQLTGKIFLSQKQAMDHLTPLT
jgi:SulP family sulfate permease